MILALCHFFEVCFNLIKNNYTLGDSLIAFQIKHLFFVNLQDIKILPKCQIKQF